MMGPVLPPKPKQKPNHKSVKKALRWPLGQEDKLSSVTTHR
jgi:hypothetical protein